MATRTLTAEFVGDTRGFEKSMSRARDATVKTAKAQADLKLQSVQVEKAEKAAALAVEKFGRESIQAREATARLEVAQKRVATTTRTIEKTSAAAGTQTKGLARDTDRLDRSLRRSGGTADMVGGRFGKMAKRAAGAGVAFAGAYASIAGAKNAVNTTVTLAKTTLALHKNLGLSVKSASEWAAVAKSRDVDAKALNMSFGTLSKNVEAAGLGFTNMHTRSSALKSAMDALGSSTKDQAARLTLEERLRKNIAKGAGGQAEALKRLGVSEQQLKAGNFNDVLTTVADGFAKLGPGTERTALSMKLFGRGWQTIVPLLRGGSKAMNEQLALAEKYGVTFKGKTIKSLEDLIAAQREAKFATMGLQVAFGTEVAPAITKAIKAVAGFVREIREGTGAGGKFRDRLEEIVAKVRPIVQFFKDHPKLIAIAVGAWVTYKAASLAALAAIKVQNFRRAFAVGKGAAAAEGALAGRAYSTSFTVAASTGVSGAAGKGGKLSKVFSGAGGKLGAVAGVAAGAAMIASLKDEKLNLRSIIENIMPVSPSGGPKYTPPPKLVGGTDDEGNPVTRIHGVVRRPGDTYRFPGGRDSARQRRRNRTGAHAPTNFGAPSAATILANRRRRRAASVAPSVGIAPALPGETAAVRAREKAAKVEQRAAKAREAFAKSQEQYARSHRSKLDKSRTAARKRREGSSDFELNVGDVRVPTVYEVRRALAPVASPTLASTRQQPTTIHNNGNVYITVDGSKNPRETAEEVASILDRARRTHGAAVRRAQAKVRRG